MPFLTLVQKKNLENNGNKRVLPSSSRRNHEEKRGERAVWKPLLFLGPGPTRKEEIFFCLWN